METLRVTKAFGRHRRAGGLRQFRLHDLRHLMATEMLTAGVPIAVVARLLDHRRVRADKDFTRRAKRLLERDKELLERLAK